MKAKVLHIISQNTKEPAILFKFYHCTSYCTSNKGCIFAIKSTLYAELLLHLDLYSNFDFGCH